MWRLLRFFQVNPFPEQHTLHSTDHFPGCAPTPKELRLGNLLVLISHNCMQICHLLMTLLSLCEFTHVSTTKQDSFLSYRSCLQ